MNDIITIKDIITGSHSGSLLPKEAGKTNEGNDKP